MQIIPIKTRVFQPPQDDLLPVLDMVLDEKLHENAIVVITSKVVAISEGRCVPVDEKVEKKQIARDDADYILESDWQWTPMIRSNAIVLSAGIDESNARGHYILLPSQPMRSAKEILDYLKRRFSLKNLGVLITDSHSIPLRYGTVGIGIGYAGFEPVQFYTGERDLFGREFTHTRINVVDSVAAAAVFVMGETTEQTPVCIVHNAPHVAFTDRDVSGALFVPLEEDIYYPLLKDFKKTRRDEQSI